MICQCPNCSKRLIITDEQASASNGAIRCGACMKLFFIDQAQKSESKNKSKKRKPEKLVNPKDDSSIKPHESSKLLDKPFIAKEFLLSKDWNEEPISHDLSTHFAAPKDEKIKLQPKSGKSLSDIFLPQHIVLPVSQKQKTRGLYFVTGVLSILGCILVINLFIVWQPKQAEELIDHPRFSRFISETCAQLYCLPNETPQIKSERLAIIEHPSIANALLVELLLQNPYSKALPYPTLAITFFNDSHTIEALAVVKPEDYLKIDGTELNQLPSKKRNSLRFVIEDTDRPLRNYQLQLIPAL